MDNRIELNKKEIQRILDIIYEKDKKYFIFLPRDYDNKKNPRAFMAEIGIDYTDAINIIKSLKFDNYYECFFDSKNEYIYLYVFKTYIEKTKTYIKLGFLHDMKTGSIHVVSFHEDMELGGGHNNGKNN